MFEYTSTSTNMKRRSNTSTNHRYWHILFLFSLLIQYIFADAPCAEPASQRPHEKDMTFVISHKLMKRRTGSTYVLNRFHAD